MERKTMGGFIAALRKANGMTQKELAEKLNVSDKSVSRWERDDGTPDLALIPVIAEIFGVTCDELLRGERRPKGERAEATVESGATSKAGKQRQRLLAVSLSKYKTRSLITMGLAVAGLIAAMTGNFGFNRAYIGFLIAAVFDLAAVICQAAFVNSAFLSVAGDDQSDAEVDRFKCIVVRWAEFSVGLTVVLLAFSLPLVIFTWDPYLGLRGETWFAYGGVYGLIALVVCYLACYFLNATLLKKGVYPLPEKEKQAWRRNRRLQRRCALGLLLVLIVTWGVHLAVTRVWDAAALSEKIVFEDYDSFAAFMEQDIPQYDSVGWEPGQAITYYDEFGNVISEEEALRESLTDGDGNVLCTYIRRNQNVSAIRYGSAENGLLPITVVTSDALREGWLKLDVINTVFIVVYVMGAAAIFIVYLIKRARS